MRVAVIGAGPAGLTAAYQLAKSEVSVDVYEASEHVGGLARSLDLWNQRVDLGPHRFFSKDLRVNRLWLEVVGKDYEMVDRLTRIYYRNEFYPYPLQPFDTLRKIGLREACHITGSYLLGQIKTLFAQRNGDSLESWLVHRFGRRLYEVFFESYSRKLWGIPPDQIDSDFAAQRIKEFSLSQLLSAAIHRGNGHRHPTLITRFAYPSRGTGMVYEKMAHRMRELGGALHLGSPVTRVWGRKSGVCTVELSSGERRKVDHVVSTMPLTLLVRALPSVPLAVLEASAALKFRNTVFVYLRVAGENPFPDQWLYVNGDSLQTGRITNYRNWVPTLYGKEMDTVVSMEYWCFDEDPLWSWSDEQLISHAIAELAASGLVEKEAITAGHVIRARRSYPVYKKGYMEHLGVMRAYLDTVEGLSVIGRYGSFKYNNQDHSMLMGMMVAENLLDGAGHDLWSINTDYRVYQEGAVITETGLERTGSVLK